jgi:hypothetical protein
MNRAELERLGRLLLAGEMDLEAFIERLHAPKSADLGDTTLDLDRRRRCGYPEVVYGEGKSVESLARIFRTLLESDAPVLATRVSEEKAAQLLADFPADRYNTARYNTARYNPRARTFRIDAASRPPHIGRVAVVTAGTSDLPVAEEARETLDWMGVAASMIHDVGVAGPHRLPAHLDTLTQCDAIVVVAGMEGALPSVVGGYVACPVIAVPTSVGYGASFGGVAALLGMLNSCAANVTVVNIDAGFKGGYIAGLIARGLGCRSLGV